MVMFGLKNILKICQKTDVTNDFVQKVIAGEYGKNIKIYCLDIEYILLYDGSCSFDDEHTDIIANNPFLVPAEINKFIIHPEEFIKINKQLYFLLKAYTDNRHARGSN